MVGNGHGMCSTKQLKQNHASYTQNEFLLRMFSKSTTDIVINIMCTTLRYGKSPTYEITHVTCHVVCEHLGASQGSLANQLVIHLEENCEWFVNFLESLCITTRTQLQMSNSN